MTRDEIQQLLAERTTLERMLADTPADDAIDRLGLQSRLDEIKDRIGESPQLAPETARARITFRGAPVVGSYGVFAEFGVAVMGSFVDAVTAVAASLASGPLKAMGPIPNRNQHQLLITHTVPGSFGFQVEEYREGLPLDPAPSPLAAALEKTQAIMDKSLASDDELAEVLSETDGRALNSLRAFLRVMVDAEASCAMQFRERTVRFSDPGQVRRTLERLGEQNVHETKMTMEGRFLGVLPQHRTLEFQDRDGRIVTGKVGPTIADAGSLNGMLGQRARAKFVETRVGAGRARYVLAELPEVIE